MIECEWKSVTSTVTYNSLKSGCAPELVGILEQGVWGHIYSPSDTIHILLFNIFVALYAAILCMVSD